MGGEEYDCRFVHKHFGIVKDFFVYPRKGESTQEACFRKLRKIIGEGAGFYELVSTKRIGNAVVNTYQNGQGLTFVEKVKLDCNGQFKRTDQALACREGVDLMAMRMSREILHPAESGRGEAPPKLGPLPRVKIEREKP